MYLPVRSGPEQVVIDWLAAIDDASPDALLGGFTQKTLRQWKRQHPGHRCFTVVRHPVERAHAAYCDKILSTDEGSFVEIRKVLRNQFKLPLPAKMPSVEYSRMQHREGFLGFLKFVKSNLAGQTNVRVDAHWTSQAQVVQGFADFATPDLILREARLAEDLAIVAAQLGKKTMPQVPAVTDQHADQLNDIYDPEIEAAVRDVYQRDYMTFGFGSYA